MASPHPIRLSRSAAEALAAFVHLPNLGLAPTSCPPAAIAELDAALTDAAAAAAWEPLRGDVLALQHRDRELTARGTSNLDQLAAAMRDTFEAAGMSIDDPDTVRTILLTVKATSAFAARAHASGAIDHHQYQGVKNIAHPIAIAAARLVDPEALS